MNIDVRTPEEFAENPRDNCQNIPLDRLMAGDFAMLAGIVHDTVMTVWCRSGARAGVAIKILKSAGFIHVENGHR